MNFLRHFLQTWLKLEIAPDIVYRFGNSFVIYLILCRHNIEFTSQISKESTAEKIRFLRNLVVVIDMIVSKHFVI